MRHTIFGCIAALAFAVSTGATAQRAPTLDEARKATDAPAFVPPPRTISDITAILDQEKPDPSLIAKLREDADRVPPAGLEPKDLAGFYFRRALAAGEVGRADQRLADLREAAKLAQPGDAGYERVLQQLATAEIRVGNSRAARDIRLKAIEVQENLPGAKGPLFSAYSNAVGLTARLGDIETAERLVGKIEALLKEAEGWRPFRVYGSVWRALVLEAKAALHEARGEYPHAEQAYRTRLVELDAAARLVPQMPNPPTPGTYEQWRDNTLRDLALVLTRQGRLVEAEIEMRRALLSQLKRRGRYAAETADMLRAFAGLLMEQRRFDEAGLLVDAAIDIYKEGGHGPASISFGTARLQKARVLYSKGQYREAYDVFRAVKQDLAPAESARLVGQNMTYVLAALRTGDIAEARKVAEALAAERQQKLGANHYEAAEANGILAIALATANEPERALALFKSAAAVLLSPSRQADEEGGAGGREVRLQIVLEGYVGLLADVQGTALAAKAGVDPATESFRLAEAARARSVSQALAASSARAAARDPDLADLARREQDAQKQIAALYGLLSSMLAVPTDQQDQAALRAVRTQIDGLRGARAKIREEIERRFPDYLNLIDPKPPTVQEARAALKPGEALVSAFVGQDRVFVWAVPHDGPVAFGASRVPRGRIAGMVRNLRKALDPNAATLGDIPQFDAKLAHQLYNIVLQPVESGWRNAKSLLVVPDRALGQIPFALLVTAPAQLRAEADAEPPFVSYRNVPWLLRQVAVTQLPSVSSFITLRRVPPGAASRQPFVGFGDPWFSKQQVASASQATVQLRGGAIATRGLPLIRRNAPATRTVDSAELAQLPRLPDTADEVKSIAAALKADPSRDVFLGRDANERTVKTADLANRKVVMFATHGLVPGDLNGLAQPALALAAPDVADVDGDGLLTIDEILALRLNADWVVLSACNTATGDGAGAEAVSGLGRAFFYAGTRALLVSNWPVETTSARALTTDLFRRQAEDPTLSRAEALRQAMVGLIDGPGAVDPRSGRTLFTYAHPIFWAPFTLVGDGG